LVPFSLGSKLSRKHIMAKKLKELAGNNADNQLVSTVRESAQQIWLAGLGAFAKAQEEGTKVFEALVKEGETLQKKTRKLAESKFTGTVDNMKGSVDKFAKQAQKSATEGWDKLEQVFEDRVSRALNSLGVPTNKDIHALTKRVEELTASVQSLAGKPVKVAAAAAAKKPAAKKAAPAKKAARK
jgi:poly(hydroxyalkanoate) granule-associated protein